jgi:inosine-uridine nucleoside N-ribohydrolase
MAKGEDTVDDHSYQAALEAFPTISESQRQRMLTPPQAPVRVVIDTDAKNEIDDQFTLAWALLSQDQLRIEGVYAVPYCFGIHQGGLIRTHEILHTQGAEQVPKPLQRYLGQLRTMEAAGIDPKDLVFPGPDVGMEESYQEILRVYEKLNLNPNGLVFRGSTRYLTSTDDPVDSPAARHLIARALASDDEPLYVVAIGCITNVVSAMLMAPEIIQRIVVVWTSGYPAHVRQPNYSFNLEQDMLASKLLVDSGVPLVYLPGFHIGAQLRISLPEMDTWVRGKGSIGDYLYWLYTNNPLHARRGIKDHFGRTWIMWDLINIAWLLEPSWIPSDLVPTPRLGDDKIWYHDQPERHLMREAYEVNRDAIFRDFLTKLQQAP